MESGFGSCSLKFLGLIPGPLENKFYCRSNIAPDFLKILEHLKNEDSFLCASNKLLDILVNIVFVRLYFSFLIRKSSIMAESAL